MKPLAALSFFSAMLFMASTPSAEELRSAGAPAQDVEIPSHAGKLVRASSALKNVPTAGAEVENTSANAYYAYYTWTIGKDKNSQGVSWAPCPDDAPYAFAGGWSVPTGVDITRSMQKAGDTSTWRWFFGKQSSKYGSEVKVQLNVVCTATPKSVETSSGSVNISSYAGQKVYMTCGSDNDSEFITGFEAVYQQTGGSAANGYVYSHANALYYRNMTGSTVTAKTYGMCDMTTMYFPDDWGYDAEVAAYGIGTYAVDYGTTVTKCACSDDKWETDILSLHVVQDVGRLSEFNNVIISDGKACLRMKLTDTVFDGDLYLGYIGATEPL